MIRTLTFVVLAALGLGLAGNAVAQDSKSATATRKKMQQKVSMSVKEVGIKAFIDDLKLELDQPIRFKIDNANGLSNNMKISFSGKDVSVEKVLNELSDKFDFGYYVISNAANNKEDGTVVIRRISKGKERGYEAGKEPKTKESSLAPPAGHDADPVRAPGRTVLQTVPNSDGLQNRLTGFTVKPRTLI